MLFLIPRTFLERVAVRRFWKNFLSGAVACRGIFRNVSSVLWCGVPRNLPKRFQRSLASTLPALCGVPRNLRKRFQRSLASTLPALFAGRKVFSKTFPQLCNSKNTWPICCRPCVACSSRRPANPLPALCGIPRCSLASTLPALFAGNTPPCQSSACPLRSTDGECHCFPPTCLNTHICVSEHVQKCVFSTRCLSRNTLEHGGTGAGTRGIPHSSLRSGANSL